ncbi:hypothetical protein [Croceicoccus estronivorus]|uniref:hypothetical protein n=1 Tax=Croceicoccus estronivorus TaxID=1172626 RepID=UPI0012E8796A|nr:hypothetical protein [Croceicoccus estronivorus]
MSLIGYGDVIKTLNGYSTYARSHSDEKVIVKYSDESLTDHGSGIIWHVAENKFSDGQFEITNGTKVITVNTEDCQKWEAEHN